jgi:hypothetical protein
LVDELETMKRDAYEGGRFELLFLVVAELERMRQMRGATLAEAFLAARSERPDETAALIAARRQDEQIARALCADVVRKLAEAPDE